MTIPVRLATKGELTTALSCYSDDTPVSARYDHDTGLVVVESVGTSGELLNISIVEARA